MTVIECNIAMIKENMLKNSEILEVKEIILKTVVKKFIFSACLLPMCIRTVIMIIILFLKMNSKILCLMNIIFTVICQNKKVGILRQIFLLKIKINFINFTLYQLYQDQEAC